MKLNSLTEILEGKSHVEREDQKCSTLKREGVERNSEGRKCENAQE